MTNYLQKIESTQGIIQKEHLDIIRLLKNICPNVLRRILLQHKMLATWNIFFCLLFKFILATIFFFFFNTVSEWIKDLLNFLTVMILWKRLISLTPPFLYNFCVIYEIMRNIHQSNGSSSGTEH